jgi:uncharacterized protein (DUF433 family)
MDTRADVRFVEPIYTLQQVGQFFGVPRSTLVHWQPFLHHLAGPRRRDPTITLIGLAEAYVLSGFRRAGVPLQRIRPAIDVLTDKIGVDHSLASRRLYTDGAEILYQWDDEHLSGLRNGQYVFRDVLREYLRLITWGEDEFPTKLQLPTYHQTEVITDPQRAFGQPIFGRTGTKVEDVLERFWAGDDLQSIAIDYGLESPDVEEAVRVASRRAS